MHNSCIFQNKLFINEIGWFCARLPGVHKGSKAHKRKLIPFPLRGYHGSISRFQKVDIFPPVSCSVMSCLPLHPSETPKCSCVLTSLTCFKAHLFMSYTFLRNSLFMGKLPTFHWHSSFNICSLVLSSLENFQDALFKLSCISRYSKQNPVQLHV